MPPFLNATFLCSFSLHFKSGIYNINVSFSIVLIYTDNNLPEVSNTVMGGYITQLPDKLALHHEVSEISQNDCLIRVR